MFALSTLPWPVMVFRYITFNVLKPLLEELNLHINIKKCQFYVDVDPEGAPVPPSIDGYQHQWSNIMEVLGAYIGARHLVMPKLVEIRHQEITRLSTLCEWIDKGMSRQDANQILMYCIAPRAKLGYILDTTEPDRVIEALGPIDEFMKVVYGKMTDIDPTRLETVSLILSRLPVRRGGGGVGSVRESAMWHYQSSLVRCGLADKDSLSDDIQPNNKYVEQLKLQPLHRCPEVNMRHNYHGSVDVYNTAGGYMRVLPTNKSNVIPDDVMIASTRIRLAVNPYLVFTAPPEGCHDTGYDFCHVEPAPRSAVATPLHPTYCFSCVSEWCQRHSSLVSTFQDVIHAKAHCRVQYEKKLSPQDSGRPDLLYTPAVLGAVPQAIDVSVTSTPLATAENAKINTYSRIYGANNVHPILFNSVGRVGPKTREYLTYTLHLSGWDKIRISVNFQRYQAHVYNAWILRVSKSRANQQDHDRCFSTP